ncbi:MAG: DUF2269 family protein [Dehalococcoidia bacterium]
MSEDEAFRLVHMLALFIYLAGLGATMVPLYRSWNSDDLNAQVYAFQEAGRNQAGVLLPGIILVGVSGLIWAIRADYVDPVETGWLLAVELIYLFTLFICLPGMAAGLRRARFLALQAQKSGEISPELRETLADRGPMVFGTLMLFLVALMAALAVTKPF